MAHLARRLRRHVHRVGGEGRPMTRRRFRGDRGSTAVELPLSTSTHGSPRSPTTTARSPRRRRRKTDDPPTVPRRPWFDRRRTAAVHFDAWLTSLADYDGTFTASAAKEDR